MTLNGVMAVILRYFSEFRSFGRALRKSG